MFSRYQNGALAVAAFAMLFAHVTYADLNYEYYEGSWSLLPDFDALTPVETGTVPTVDISVRNRDDQFVLVQIPVHGRGVIDIALVLPFADRHWR